MYKLYCFVSLVLCLVDIELGHRTKGGLNIHSIHVNLKGLDFLLLL